MMNKTNLKLIFDNYISRFDEINRVHEEYYKWQICAQFKDMLNIGMPDGFADRLRKCWQLSDNLIDSRWGYAFSYNCDCARKDPERVRRIYLELYAEDNGDLTLRQQKIDRFLKEMNGFKIECGFDGDMFMDDQRTAMAYLFLYDPDGHYLYKAMQARDFAEYVEFIEDWGSMHSFNLATYHRMCDELVEEIRAYPPLIEKNRTRYVFSEWEPQHADSRYHILAFDIIYSTVRYCIAEGLEKKKYSAKEKQWIFENRQKALQVKASFDRADEERQKLLEAISAVDKRISVGTEVIHNRYGEGVVQMTDADYLYVRFDNEVRKLSKTVSLGNRIIRLKENDSAIESYREILKNAGTTMSMYRSAANSLAKVSEYIDA